MSDDGRWHGDDDATSRPRSGVLALRVWLGPDGELMGRVQWATSDGRRGSTAHTSVKSLIADVWELLSKVAGEEGEASAEGGGPGQDATGDAVVQLKLTSLE